MAGPPVVMMDEAGAQVVTTSGADEFLASLPDSTGTDAGVRADSGRIPGPRGPVIYAAVANWNPAVTSSCNCWTRSTRRCSSRES